MTTSNDRKSTDEWGGRLSPSDVHNVLFTRAGLGRRGYDEVEVDVFLERVQQEITRLIAEKADLRDEVSRLKGQLAAVGAAPGAGSRVTKEEAELQAVRLLAAAQQTADVYVADAEKYSQRLTLDARQHSEQVVEEAKQAAQQMVQEAERIAREAASRTIEGEPAGAAEPTKQQLDQQIAYLKTFSQVCRVQLRAYLEALLRDVEEEWGRADPGVVLGTDAPSALPAGSGDAASDQAGPSGAEPDEAAGRTGEVDAKGDGDPVVDVSSAASNGNGSPRGPRRRDAATSHAR